MQNLAAQVTSSLLQFPETTIEALREDEINLESVLRAKFTTGRAGLAWLACGPQLEVTNSVTSERLSAYCFSTVTERPPTVVAVKEFSWQKKTGLLVGLVEAEGSILCLYDIGISKVVKAVVLPGSVTAIEPLISDGGASASTQHLHQSLRWFFGVAAVVTDVGHVLLIDLCLDDISSNQDELEASDLEVISGIPAEIPKLREAANRERRHLCLQLLAPSGTTVTTVNYISRTNQLAVGFSDGYLSLWNMKTLRREYHVQVEGGRVPVYSVTFQEPENDPRNCCYLWVVQTSQSGRDLSFYLLQLAFGDRKCLPSGQIMYENFEYCEERYNLDLSANALFLRGQTNSMRLLGCQTIEKFRSHSEREDGLHDVSSPDTSVSIFSWQVNTYGQNKPSVYMGVFDINRWYQAQMPDSLRPGQFLRNCSYFAFWSLEALTNMTEDAIFDILVHERSLSRGVPPSYPPPEQFFFPSTYNFDATCLLNSGVIHFTCTGFQKETLHYLKNSGSSLNEEIPDGYNRCLVAGLLSPRLADVQPSSLTQEEQLQAVLSAAVETSSISLLTRCIKQWIEEEQPRSAPNLRFVLEWTWNKVALTKKEFDKLCAPLFDGSCNFVDSQTLQSLQHCHLRLGNLTSVLNCFRKEAKELTKQGLIDLTNKLSVTTLLTQYASVVLWFCRCGLLPDNPDEAMQLTRPYYNYQLMQHYYAERRKKLEHLSRGKWNASTLMIDNMICQLGERVEHLWKRDEGGTGKYPPPTLHALLDLYLLEDADEIKKHAITVYFLLDVMYSFPDKPDSSIESFPTAFTVPCGLIKLIQGFWLLDHNDYQNSVDCILHPAASRVMTWQHNLIIETLMCQGDHRQALRYIQVIKPPISNSTEVKLHMTVFLANRHIFEAWNLQKLHSSRLNVEELLKHMYESCQEMGLMEDLLKLTFTDSEQDYLHKFLHTNGGVQNQELLLVHHLQRANYIPALQLNQSLKNYHLNDSDRRQRERAVARKSILDQYGKILPSVQQTLASDRTRPYPSIIWKKVARPKPLSTITKQAPTGSVITEANFIRNVLMKIKEVSVASENKDFSPYKSFIEESPSPVPQVTELEMPDAFVGTPISKTRRDSRLLGSLVHPILAESSFGVDFENFSCKTPTKSSVLLTSSPVQLNLLKSTQLKNLSKASEFNLLETPLVVKKAKALVASSASSGFMARTPQSILRSSAHTTPLASPSVSPGRSVTPPLRSKETKISFMEQISKKYTKGVLTEHEEPTVSPVLKSGQETMWADRVAMLTQNDAATDNEEMDESSSGIQDGSPSKMEVNKDASNVSARSDQTTLEYHDAPTPEDLEDEVVTKINFSQSTHVHTDIDTVVVPEDVKPPAEFLETEERDVLNTEGLFAHECEPKVLHKLPQVPEPDPQVDSFSDPLEDNPQPTEPQSDSSSRSSVSVISLHDSEDIESAHSEPLDQERRVDNEADLLIMEQNVLIVEEIPAVPAPPSHFVEIQDLNDKVTVEDPEPEVTYQQIGSFGNLDMESNVVREYCNNYEAADEKDSVDARTDVEDEHSLVPNNFSLVLEGDAGDDYAEVESLKADHPIYETLKESSKDSCSSTDENINLVDKVSKEDSCVNALTLSGTEQETKIAESLPYMPEPIKVAIAENLLDVLKETRSKDFTSELKSDLVYENEPVRKLRNIHTTSRSPVKKIKQTNREDLNTNTVKRITPPEKSEEQKLDLDDLETSPSEVKSTLIKPPTPRRSIRKTTKVPESTSDSELPMTPKRRGRKAKENSENVDTTLATLQEEQHSIITRISRRAKGSVSDEPQFTETETVVQETVPKLPSSPARTRRGKASTLDDQINVGDNVDQKIDIPMTPTRITRSSKVVQESENVQSVQHVETEPLVTTPIRGRRGKRMVNELVKQFELGASQASTKSNSSPPVSPKKVSLRWSRVRSENQIEQKSADEDNVTEQEPVADTPKKTVKKSVRKVDVEDSTDLAEEQQRTTRLTRTRSNNVLKPDTTTVEFVFATPTQRRRKNAKAEQTAPPISPKEMPAPVSSEYVFSPPSLRTRRFTRTTLSTIVDLKEKDVTVEESQDTIALVSEVEPAVVPEPEVKPRRGRPPKHRVKKNQPEDKAAWSPPPVKIQLLSPPESPDGDTESTKPLSLETKAAERNQSRKTRRRIVTSKPVTRRKIR